MGPILSFPFLSEEALRKQLQRENKLKKRPCNWNECSTGTQLFTEHQEFLIRRRSLMPSWSFLHLYCCAENTTGSKASRESLQVLRGGSWGERRCRWPAEIGETDMPGCAHVTALPAAALHCSSIWIQIRAVQCSPWLHWQAGRWTTCCRTTVTAIFLCSLLMMSSELQPQSRC